MRVPRANRSVPVMTARKLSGPFPRGLGGDRHRLIAPVDHGTMGHLRERQCVQGRGRGVTGGMVDRAVPGRNFVPMRRSIRTITLALALAGAASAQAQTNVPSSEKTPFVLGETRTFRSAVLGQERVLNIYLPDGYAADTVPAYPVVYVLDGSANEDFVHIAGLVQFMNMYALWPKSIVVGIGNVDRRHDFTPLSADTADMHMVPQAGGSAAFLDFLEREVEPLVQANYRAGGARTLIGQSLAGLMALDVFLARPQLFDNYIIVSPSTWWNKGAILDRADASLSTHAQLKKQVFLALGTEGEDMQQNMDRLIASFKAHAGLDVKWHYQSFPGESHATILHRAVYRAFEVMNVKK